MSWKKIKLIRRGGAEVSSRWHTKSGPARAVNLKESVSHIERGELSVVAILLFLDLAAIFTDFLPLFFLQSDARRDKCLPSTCLFVFGRNHTSLNGKF